MSENIDKTLGAAPDPRLYGTHVQCWPGGESIEYWPSDSDHPEWVRHGHSTHDQPWVAATKDDVRKITVERRAQTYVDRDVLCCDSSLVTDLMEIGSEGRLEGFTWDDVVNLRPDPSDWDGDRLREWVSDHVGDDALPALPTVTCEACHGAGEVGPNGNPDTVTCPACAGEGERVATLEEADEDDAYLDALREVVRDHAEDAEVYEWWRVTGWLAEKLKAIGEVVLANNYGDWWGRTCTGQGMLMDGTLQQVAREFV